MKNIVIVCAGTYGREVLSVVNEINRISRIQTEEEKYKILGFLDDNPKALAGSGIDLPILGTIEGWKPMGDEVYAIGAAFPAMKEKIVSKLKEKGCVFETLVAPWSMVSADVEMGEGCFITAYSISASVKLGRFVNINGSMLCPGAVVGDFSTTTGFTVVDNALVGKRVFIGSHAVICSGVHVGDDSQVSVGSIVQQDVEEGTTVFGVPATQI